MHCFLASAAEIPRSLFQRQQDKLLGGVSAIAPSWNDQKMQTITQDAIVALIASEILSGKRKPLQIDAYTLFWHSL